MRASPWNLVVMDGCKVQGDLDLFVSDTNRIAFFLLWTLDGQHWTANS